MILVDVNVLINAFRVDAARHPEYKTWLQEALVDRETIGVPGVVAISFLRIVTHPDIYRKPSSLADSTSFIDGVRASPVCRVLVPGERHWTLVKELCARYRLTGAEVHDADLAALAIEQGAEIVSDDSDFGRFREIRWRRPLGAQA